MNGCDKFESLLARFIHGEVLLHEKEDLERHLAVCAECEKLYEDITGIDRLLKASPHKLVDPPPYLRAKILANLPEEQAVPFGRGWAKWAAGVAAAAACALVAVALYRGAAPKGDRVASLTSPPGESGAPVSGGAAPATAARSGATLAAPAAPPSSAPSPRIQVIKEVRIYFYYPPAQKVAVTGDFNDWDRDGVPLKRAGKPGLWETRLRLKPGAYSYNFIVDGEVLVPDPNAPDQMPDGYGGTNSILLVKGERPA